ncbi:PIN domain-containing protein [Streptomyces sp. NPDC050848]|uniref:PIN domain-containing protein n=1 Tax=Streptomyces sp. NPDC050848 TaxID=3155791 RepID=UPI003401E4AD
MADTSGVLVAFDSTAPGHDKARWVLDSAGTVVMSPLVLAELDHLSRKKPVRILPVDAEAMMVDLQRRLAEGRLLVPEITAERLDKALYLRRIYSALDLDLADATTMVLAVEWGTCHVLTTDRRDFLAVRMQLLPGDGCFEVLPADF